MLHVSASKKRRVEPWPLLDLVVIGKIADEDVNDLLLGFVDIDRSQAGKQLVHPEKQNSYDYRTGRGIRCALRYCLTGIFVVVWGMLRS